MRKIILFQIFLLATTICFGQESSKKNTLAINFGMTHLARQDLVFSPLVHKDLSFLNFGIEYIRQAKLFQKVSLRYGNFNPMTNQPYSFSVHGEAKTAAPHSFNMINIDYLLGTKIKTFEKSNLTLGGLFSMDIQALNYVYGRIGNFGYYSETSLGVFLNYDFSINEKNYLSTTLQIPVVSWLARSPFAVNDDEFIENTSSHSGFKTFISFLGDGNVAAWHNWQSFDYELKYMYSFNERWQLGVAYLFEFIHSSQPRQFFSYRNTLNLSANIKF